MSITVEHTKENLCSAHIYAVAGMAGVGLGIHHVHDYGVDGEFAPVVVRNGRRAMNGFRLDFQAKATINWTLKSGKIVYSLESKTWNDMVTRTEAETKLILILLCLPPFQIDWHSVSPTVTTLRNCCYWHIVDGDAVENEKSKKTVYIPENQVFSPEALVDLLMAERIRRELQIS